MVTLPEDIVTLKDKDQYIIGVISDTHGLLREWVYRIFASVDLIIHAGDVGGREILKELKTLAPLVAVQGNMDAKAADPLPPFDMIAVGEATVLVLHDLNDLDVDPGAAHINAVISGHTHRPRIETKNGVLFLNPGSAGPRRFDYPISVAILAVAGTTLTPEIHTFTP